MKTLSKQFSGVTVHVRPDVFHHVLCPDTPIDDVVAEEVIVRDCYKLRHLLNSGFAPKTCVDLGANIGTFSTFVQHLWPRCEIVAVEAMAGYRELLNLNCNGTVVTALAGGLPPCQDYETIAWLRAAYMEAPVLSLHEIISHFGNREVDLLKTDIEGAEQYLFDEARRCKLMSRFHVLPGEWHGQEGRRSVIDACHGSHFLMLDGRGDHNTFLAIRMH
jgi:hypothetical protein